ncbi:MAG TPA: hypothetical protein VHB25_15190 [Gemmatimonadaceae bacterium]|nr:hypothetical protein [Gemmatimonadaceae bacterium]
MRVLCVGRHPYLSEHLCRFFEQLDVQPSPCVGLADAAEQIRAVDPDAVICDYDLLATACLSDWETDPVLASVPIIAVSMTRHPGEAHLLDVNGVAGFLYLPTLDLEHAQRVFASVRRKRNRGIHPPDTLPWSGTTTPIAQMR